MTANKSSLREQMRSRLALMSESEVQAHSAAVWERLAIVPVFKSARSIGVYVSIPGEIVTHGLIRQLLAMRREVGVPTFDGKRYRLEAIQDFDADLIEGSFGILEPKQAGNPVRPDVWLVPGLVFDVNGNRLGRGRGYFDALLQGAGGAKIALAHDFQVLDEVPSESHDIGMDFIITESRVVKCKG